MSLVRGPGGSTLSRQAATGNRFVLWDRIDDARTPEDEARALESRLAPGLCRAAQVDGLLTRAAPRAGGSLRMVLHNADGGRAEMCGNGLRVLACASLDRLPRDGPAGALQIETDAGTRPAHALRDPDGVARRARVSLGTPRLLAVDEPLSAAGVRVLAHVVDVGNPHCVVFVSDLSRVDLSRLGPALERHPRFPQRTNVELVERGREGLRLRVWERGVGETASCGSGVVAAAFAAQQLHGQPQPVRVETRGGSLRVSCAPDAAWLEGPVAAEPLTAAECARIGTLLAAAAPGPRRDEGPVRAAPAPRTP